jgi:hypothetical protein
MRLDIYRRPENGGKYSYLAVPEGKMIPEEATSLDWEATERGLNFNEDNNALEDFQINAPMEQISAKGYAITSVKDLDS